MVSKFRSTTRGFSFPSWSVPFALLVLTLLSYGLRAFGLGFFWDDFPYLWFFNRLGPQGIVQAFTGDRPFLSFLYITSLTLFGHSNQSWQLFAMAARWLTSVGLWWVLSLAWPRQAHKAAWAAFLFAVYPGFTQQWIALIYGQAFVLYAALFFSIGLMLWLARSRNRLARGWIAIGMLVSLALAVFNIFSTEYFFGLELLRPVLLWMVLSDTTPTDDSDHRSAFRRRIRSTAAWWAPYVVVMVAFVIWRGFFHSLGSYQLSTLENAEQSPLQALLGLGLTIFSDLVQSVLVAWGQPLQLSGVIAAGADIGARLAVVILFTGLVALAYLAFLRPVHCDLEIGQADRLKSRLARFLQPWPVQAILLGLFAMLIAGWPFWITGLPLRMGFPQDRFTLPLAPGACLLLAGLLDMLGKRFSHKIALLAFAIAMAAGFHYNTALAYRQDWNTARDFFWQLTWRAPSIEPNTLVLSDSMPFRFYEDDSLSAPLNWTYDPLGHSAEMKYLLFDILVRYHERPAFKPGQPIKKDFRATTFTGSPDKILVFSYAPPGCVRILDPIYDAALYRLPDRVLKTLSLSNPRLLISDQQPGAAPPQDIFGSEPNRRWCYYFEKADLARQKENWREILSISKQSIRVGYRPEDPVEYLPFIEAYLRLGYWDDGYEMTKSTAQESPALRPALCAVWKRSTFGHADPSAAERYSSRANSLLSCPAP